MSSKSFKGRLWTLASVAELIAGNARAQHSIHPPDLLPAIRQSPLLATPEPAKLDAFRAQQKVDATVEDGVVTAIQAKE